MLICRRIFTIIFMSDYACVADGNLVNPGGRVHVSEGYGQDIFSQVV